ncbi:MAG: hypothetical protein GY788_06405 [bacterium]|nr:hypothetical protein [bacterium]
MNTPTTDLQLRSGLLTGALLAVVWVVAALAQPTSTYHLAPILIAGAVPVIARQKRSATPLLLAAASGGLIAATASVALAAFDLMRGPTLLPYGGAFAEALTFTVAGVAIGGLIGWFIPSD